MARTAFADIETDGLYLDVKNFWVGVLLIKETKKFEVYYTPEEMVDALNTCDMVVFHNGVAFDIPVLEKLTNKKVTVPIIDTLLLGKLAYYDKDKSFKHSLEAYGERLGFPKGEHNDWSQYSPEMEEYCKRDVEVTAKLYTHLLRKTSSWLSREALELEQEVQRIIAHQEYRGWVFDVDKAHKLHIELIKELDEASKTLGQVFKPLLLPFGKVREPKKPFKRLGVQTVGPNQPIRLSDFNPGSGHHIYTWCTRLGWYDGALWPLTEKGTPKTDAETLKELFEEEDWAQPLLHYIEVQKLLGQLAEGPKAWLKLVRKHPDGYFRLHGGADILGTVTGRFTHNNPNLAQVPSVRAYKGKEARELFTVKQGYKLVGADASGLELRTLSHFLARYDKGEYGNKLLTEDIHTANQEAAGLPTRDDAKTFIYAFLYGAGDMKIGRIINKDKTAGAALKRTFTRKVRGLKQLIEGVQRAAKRGYLKGISGRRLYVRSQHSALNTLLQSTGAYYMKYFLIEAEKRLKNFDAHFVGNIHDEVQVEVKEDQAEEVKEILEQTFVDVGEQIGMRIKMEGEARIGNNWKETH
ncbi:MAG: DNA polymerase [Desulfurococcales archaeon ex4484_217_2]|nr:MAG: DNA polymerase [Desulfurococcales archaeon ex4484_217_2]